MAIESGAAAHSREIASRMMRLLTPPIADDEKCTVFSALKHNRHEIAMKSSFRKIAVDGIRLYI